MRFLFIIAFRVHSIYNMKWSGKNSLVIDPVDLIVYKNSSYIPLLPTAYVRDGRLCFQSVHTRGVPHLHLRPMVLPLVPCPFWGGTPALFHYTFTGPMSFLVVTQWLVPGQDGRRRYPHLEMGYPMAKSGWGGYTMMGVPPARDGVPPGKGQQLEYLICRGRYASCIHAGWLSCFVFIDG